MVWKVLVPHKKIPLQKQKSHTVWSAITSSFRNDAGTGRYTVGKKYRHCCLYHKVNFISIHLISSLFTKRYKHKTKSHIYIFTQFLVPNILTLYQILFILTYQACEKNKECVHNIFWRAKLIYIPFSGPCGFWGKNHEKLLYGWPILSSGMRGPCTAKYFHKFWLFWGNCFPQSA